MRHRPENTSFQAFVKGIIPNNRGASPPGTMAAPNVGAWSRQSGIERGSSPRDKETRMAGEAPIQQALKGIDDQLHDDPGLERVELVDEASRRLEPSPVDPDLLFRHLAH